jgi:hypothetical protein
MYALTRLDGSYLILLMPGKCSCGKKEGGGVGVRRCWIRILRQECERIARLRTRRTLAADMLRTPRAASLEARREDSILGLQKTQKM